MYWIASGGIGRARIDGTDVESDFILTDALESLAVRNGYLYWTQRGDLERATIGRAKVDGSDVRGDFVAPDLRGILRPIALDDEYL